LNKELLDKINKDGRIYIVPSESKGRYFLRYVIGSTRTEADDINFAWNAIAELAEKLLL